jgi:hypothetical protein
VLLLECPFLSSSIFKTGVGFMQISKEITHIEFVESIAKANEMLQNGYVLIDTVKQRDNDIDGYVESIGFVLGC